MMKTIDWLYRPCDIHNLEQCQRELMPLIDIAGPNVEKLFLHIDVEKVRKLSPTYTAEIERLGLLDRWSNCALIVTNGAGAKEFPIHLDSVKAEERSIALNIPLLNCEDTYTVWYQANNPYVNADYDKEDKREVVTFDEAGAVEIDRMPATTCAFVNVAVPHRPISNHTNYRAVLSSRFFPELFDYFA